MAGHMVSVMDTNAKTPFQITLYVNHVVVLQPPLLQLLSVDALAKGMQSLEALGLDLGVVLAKDSMQAHLCQCLRTHSNVIETE